MSVNKKSVNRLTLTLFAPLLILLGVAGFLIPAQKSLTSGAISYNIFHLIFGIIGIAILLLKEERWVIIFNIGFGLIDLYQALASYLDLFPERFFRWTLVDDVSHVIVGLGLVIIGLYGVVKRRHKCERVSARGGGV
jgi:hypothetical protein